MENAIDIASIGDVIYCDVQNPYPQTLREVLATQDACDYGSVLIATGRWKLEKQRSEGDILSVNCQR